MIEYSQPVRGMVIGPPPLIAFVQVAGHVLPEVALIQRQLTSGGCSTTAARLARRGRSILDGKAGLGPAEQQVAFHFGDGCRFRHTVDFSRAVIFAAAPSQAHFMLIALQ